MRKERKRRGRVLENRRERSCVKGILRSRERITQSRAAWGERERERERGREEKL